MATVAPEARTRSNSSTNGATAPPGLPRMRICAAAGVIAAAIAASNAAGTSIRRQMLVMSRDPSDFCAQENPPRQTGVPHPSLTTARGPYCGNGQIPETTAQSGEAFQERPREADARESGATGHPGDGTVARGPAQSGD